MTCAEPSSLYASPDASTSTSCPISVSTSSLPPTAIRPLNSSFGSVHLIAPVFQSTHRSDVGDRPAPSELLPSGPNSSPFTSTLVCQWLDNPSCSQIGLVSPVTSKTAPPKPRPAVTKTLVPSTTGSGALTPI